TQTDVGIAPHHSQQKPDLLLPLIYAARIAPDEIAWHVVSQPIPCTSQYAHMLGQQAHFFVELAVHGLHRAFAVFDATLGKLPRMFADAFAPEHLVFVVYEDNADIGTVAFTV